jgi:uncharacterized protein YqeY
MTLVQRVNEDITAAMRAKDQARLAPLRMLKTALTNRSIEKGHELDDTEAQQVVSSLIKQRRDSIEQFQKGNRQDLVDRETAEIGVLETYLPPPASAQDIDTAVGEAIAETGATSMKDMGRVMKAAMGRLSGRAVDGKAVNEAVRRRLG